MKITELNVLPSLLQLSDCMQQKKKSLDSKALTPSMIVSAIFLYANRLPTPAFISLAVYIEFKIVQHSWEYEVFRIPEFGKAKERYFQKYKQKQLKRFCPFI
jgi:hypothetical protein